MFNPFRRRSSETRASYANAALMAAHDAATGNTGASADALAVVESCTSLIADPFLVARVQGRPVPPGQLHQMARDLLRRGNSVWAIDVVDGQLELYNGPALGRLRAILPILPDGCTAWTFQHRLP